MSELKTMKAVYCYFFPETRSLLHKVEAALPDDMFKVTTPVERVRGSIDSLFDPPLDVPATADGNIDLDEIHVPIIKRVIGAYSTAVPDLGSFLYSYPTSGSSEGIFHLLTNLKVNGVSSINVLKGEYEGYGAQAQNLGMKVNEIDPEKTDVKKLEPGVWFVSNPSARDGNIIPNEYVRELCDSGHRVVVDLAYVGATRPYEFDVSHENITAVVMSFSKPYGVFRFRIGGFTFSREEKPTLYGNKWFKDVPGLFQALKIAEEIGPTRLHERYKGVQYAIIEDINRELGLGMRPSDSFLLAHLRKKDAEKLNPQQLAWIEPFKRGNDYRFCLTPYFEMKEAQKC